MLRNAKGEGQGLETGMLDFGFTRKSQTLPTSSPHRHCCEHTGEQLKPCRGQCGMIRLEKVPDRMTSRNRIGQTQVVSGDGVAPKRNVPVQDQYQWAAVSQLMRLMSNNLDVYIQSSECRCSNFLEWRWVRASKSPKVARCLAHVRKPSHPSKVREFLFVRFHHTSKSCAHFLGPPDLMSWGPLKLDQSTLVG
jgi:hypothetical protein